MAKKDIHKNRPTKLKIILSSLIIITAGLVLVGIYDYYSTPKVSAPPSTSLSYEKACLEVNEDSCAISMEIADDDQKRVKGLSGRLTLPENEGMIFVFDEPDEQCFWMRGMQFPLDMVWVKENREVIKIDKNVSPETYPTQFCSGEPIKYVIELNSGISEKLSVEQGKTLTFK